MRLQTVCNNLSSLCRLPPDQLCFRFEDQYEAALVDLINKKRAGQPITKKERPAAGNVVDLMDALRLSVGGAEPAKLSKPSKKPRKAASGQKEMLMSIVGKKPAKEAAAKKTASKPQRKSPSNSGGSGADLLLNAAKGVMNDQGQGDCDDGVPTGLARWISAGRLCRPADSARSFRRGRCARWLCRSSEGRLAVRGHQRRSTRPKPGARILRPRLLRSVTSATGARSDAARLADNMICSAPVR